MSIVTIPIFPSSCNASISDNDASSSSLSSSCPPPEWAMIELNGQLCLPLQLNQMNHEDKLHLELGSLYFDKNKVPKMVIGSHELTGVCETLKQPFCILKKKNAIKTQTRISSLQQNCDSSTSSPKRQKMLHDTNNTNTNSKSSTCYEIAGVITKRILFDSYPKSILR